MEAVAYPQFYIYLVLAIGLPLAFLRPFGGFLFALVLLTAGHIARFNQTRLASLGPLLNLTDACVLVALVGFFFDRIANKKTIRMPQIVWLLLLVVSIGAIQSSWKFGWTHETLRSFRWGLQLPAFFFLGANLVTSPARAKKLVGALLLAVVLAAIQHLVFVMGVWRSKSLDMKTYHLMRTLGYWTGCMASAFLATAVVWRMPTRQGERVLCFLAGVLMMASLFLNQTRSLWLATAGAIPGVFLVFGNRCSVSRIVKFVAVIGISIIVTAWVLQRVMPGLDLFEITTERVTQLVSRDRQFRAQTGTRRDAFEFETGAWWDGTLVFGRGLWFIQGSKVPNAVEKYSAFAHLGYVTYLSQTGLLGFIVYAFCLPIGVLRDARWLWNFGGSDLLCYTGLLGGASIICLSLLFAMSSHFLMVGYEAPGVLYGAMWALARDDSIVIVYDGMSLAAQGGQS